MLETYLK
jgi:hypothetical protein